MSRFLGRRLERLELELHGRGGQRRLRLGEGLVSGGKVGRALETSVVRRPADLRHPVFQAARRAIRHGDALSSPILVRAQGDGRSHSGEKLDAAHDQAQRDGIELGACGSDQRHDERRSNEKTHRAANQTRALHGPQYTPRTPEKATIAIGRPPPPPACPPSPGVWCMVATMLTRSGWTTPDRWRSR